jgi:cytochrome c peroxidase
MPHVRPSGCSWLVLITTLALSSGACDPGALTGGRASQASDPNDETTDEDGAPDAARDSVSDNAAQAPPATGAEATALPFAVRHPTDNPTSPAKVALGRQLFWDPILSGDRDVACASCHHPSLAYADARRLSIGVGGSGLGAGRAATGGAETVTTRNAMTILDTAFNGAVIASAYDPTTAPMFWDNRVTSLEEQARGPILSAGEMRGSSFDAAQIFPEIVTRLEAIPEYVASFEVSFGAGPITDTAIVQAISAFERTLVDAGSSYDRFVKGDVTALSPAQRRGMAVFERGGCAACHSGPMFSDYKLHRLGVPDLPGAARDLGAGAGAFRTPSLRNVTRTAPYMHNGALGDLDQVFGFYARVDRRLDPALARVRAPSPAEAADVKAFLGALSDGTFDTTVPTSVPSGLTPGGAI